MRSSTLEGRGARPGLRLTGALACGAAAATAYPPLGWQPLVVLAVAGLTLVTRGASARLGALVGFVAGLAFFLPLLAWLRVVEAEAWVGVAVLEAVSWLLLGAGLAAVSRLRAWPLWASAVWVLVELVRSVVPFGGFPWGRLGFAVTGSTMLGWAALGGAVAVSVAVALAGQLLAWAVLRLRTPPAGRRRVAAVLAALAGVAVLAAGGALVPRGTDGRTVTVAVVQGDVPWLGVGRAGARLEVLRNHVAATEALAAAVRAGTRPAPDLVIWPENASDVDPFRDPAARALIDRAVRAVGVPVLVGTVVYPDATSVANTGVVWDPATGPGERYVKRHLVPFGEYVPYRPLFAGLSALLALIPRDFVAGDRPGVLRVASAVVGDVICFEVAFDDIVRDVVVGGADLLVVQTNNATYGATAQPDQQFDISRLRAVEHGRTVVVAATTGTSGVIAPDGTVVARPPQHRPEVVVERVALRTGRTVADAFGPWPERVLAAVGLLGVVLGLRRRPARGSTPPRRAVAVPVSATPHSSIRHSSFRHSSIRHSSTGGSR